MLRCFFVLFILLSSQRECICLPKLSGGPQISWLYYVKVLVFLGLIIGFLYLLYFILKVNIPQQDRIKMLRVIDKIYLEQGVSLYIIKILDSNWLIGVGNKEIKLIEKLGKIDYSTGEYIENKAITYKNIIDNVKKNFIKNLRQFFRK
jgi:flagellar biogenesis protein FliO